MHRCCALALHSMRRTATAAFVSTLFKRHVRSCATAFVAQAGVLLSAQLKRLVERSEVALAEPAVLNSARKHLTDFAHVHRLVRVPAVLTRGRLRIFLCSFGAAAGAVQPKASAASTDYRFRCCCSWSD